MATTENTYTGDGSTVLYNFTFPYIDETDVYVSVNGASTTAYSYANATTIQFTTAPASGAAIKIFRATNSADTKAAFFAGSAIRSKDLNDNFTQSLYIAQESENIAVAAEVKANNAEASAATANTNATAAAASAATATQQATASAASSASALAASQQASTDAAAAQASSTASAASSAQAASDAAQAATDSATAVTTAQGAVTTANSASTLATTADGNATTSLNRVNTYLHDGTNPVGDGVGNNPQGLLYAINTANAASSTAASATATANSSSTTVSTYVHDGTNPAGDGVGGNPQGLAYALNQASSAVATANAAAASVAAAAFYSPYAALANLPGSPSNGDRAEVANSTGVESSSAVSGVPSGFVGATDLTVRIQYNSTTSKWEWQNYFASDPDNRYFTQTSGNANTTAIATKMPLAGGTFSGAVNFDDDVVLRGDTTNGSGEITLNCENNSHGVKIKGPAHSAGATYTLTLPTGLPATAGMAITSDTNGNLDFTVVQSDALITPQTITASKEYDANSNIGLMGPQVTVASSAILTVPASSVLTII